MTVKRALHRSTFMLPKRPFSLAFIRHVAVASSTKSLPSTRLLSSTRQLAEIANESKSQSSKPTFSSDVTYYNSALSRSRRSMLYVPGSSEKMIKKSQSSHADTIIFDLEDSVASHKKGSARETVFLALEAAERPGPELAVRINPPSSDPTLAQDDLDMVLPSQQLQAIVVPKVESVDDISVIIDKAKALRRNQQPLSLILSVESAASLLRMPTIIETIRQSLGQDAWTGISTNPNKKSTVAQIVALLFASEDYCASTNIVRTRSRKSLLFPRSHMATMASAYNLQSIDMVCIDYKDVAYLTEEAQEAKELGYDGKQAIHPAQVDTIQHTFNPSEEAVERAARILHLYQHASANENKGAYGLKEKNGGMTMIDRPMLLQAEAVMGKARKAGIKVPTTAQLEQYQ